MNPSNKLSSKVIDERLGDRPIKRLGEYINMTTDIPWKCLIPNCGYIWDATPKNVVHAKHPTGCPKCAGNLPLNNAVIDELLIGKNIKRLGSYITSETPIPYQCLICSHIWTTKPSHIIHSESGCPECEMNSRHARYAFSNDDIDQFFLENDIPIKRISEYFNMQRDMEWQCLRQNCNRVWKSDATTIIHSGCWCPNCYGSGFNERLLIDALTMTGINFEPQYSVRSISANAPRYRIDAFIPPINLAIEYNGAQHYRPVSFGGIDKETANENFIKQQKRDEYVRELCLSNNIELIEIDGRKYASHKLTNYLNNELIPYIKSKTNHSLTKINNDQAIT